jgi:transcriptional regulator with XRE-family HTH domain
LSQKAPNSIDKHVGQRIRARRMVIGLSQEKLGAELGITFQQVQKYEKGTNRIGSGRLQQIANTLAVPVAYFYEGQEVEGVPRVERPEDLVVDRDCVTLLKAFNTLEDRKLRDALISIAQAMSHPPA